MSDSRENRVLSAKTSRGSQIPNRSAGRKGILQSTPPHPQSKIGVEDVRRLLALGKLLRSVLTLEELEELRHQVRE